MFFPLSLLSCELQVYLKENLNRKKIKYYEVFALASFMFEVIFL